MATAADVDLTGWVRQLESPFYDGNNPSVLRSPTSAYFFGYPYSEFSSITINSVVTADTSTEAPMSLFASASDVSAVGTRSKTATAVNPYLDLEYRWTLTKNDDTAVEDLESLTDPRTGNSFNPYTDQIGPEFTCMLREPGTYKLKLTARGMSSTFGTVIEQTATKTITVTASTLTKTWYDFDGGDAANDGLDPWGFALTTASYTHSTRELTQSGAFTSYVHDVSVPYTMRDNYIYITLAGVTGLYEIESKTSNDTIVLKTGLGSDQSNVTSSNGPKANWAGNGDTSANEEIMLKGGGSSYDVSAALRCNNKGGSIAVTGYNGTPTVSSTTSSGLIDLFGNSSGAWPSYFRLTNVKFDGQDGRATATSTCISGINSSTVDTATSTFTIDKCSAVDSSNDTTITIQSGQSQKTTHFMCYDTYVDGRYNSTGRSSSTMGIFSYFSGWQRALCVTIDNDADNSILDHFWYPTGYNMDHFHCAYMETRDGSGNNYALNTNMDVAQTANYLCFNNNLFGNNSNWTIDFSNASNTETSGRFNNVLIANNKANVKNGFTFHYTLVDARISYNQSYGSTAFSFHNHAAPSSPNYTDYLRVIDNNEIYNTAGLLDRNKDYPIEIQDNIVWRTGNGVAMSYDTLTDVIDVDGNNFYAPDKTDSNIIDADGTEVTVATINTTFSASNTSSLPSWPDPANGNFGGVPTGMEVSI